MSDASPMVFIIDDDSSVRRALGRLMKSAGLAAQVFASALDFLTQSPPEGPACIVLDVDMPAMNGLDLQRILSRKNGSLPIIFITGHGDIPMSVRAMKDGAFDFLPKPFHERDLLSAVHQAIAKHAEARHKGAERAEIQGRACLLSPREREVMALVVRGMLNKHAGHALGVTEKTIKVHRARVMHKMQAGSLAELVRMAEKIL